MGDTSKNPTGLETAKRDVVMLGIATAAIIMFVGIGGTVLPAIVGHWVDKSVQPPDVMLINALLLNIALIIFGWRRYADLQAEVQNRRAAEERARELAQIDALTGCLNRRSATEQAAALLAPAPGAQRGAAFVMIDLDGFKEINDTNGHQAGDEVLMATAERLRSLAPSDASVARLGGDEFAVLMPFDSARADRLDLWLTKLVDAVARPIECHVGPVEVTVSAGIATQEAVEEGADPVEVARGLMHQADLAMYHAKKNGRNRYSWFEESMETEARFRREMEAAIKKGLERGEFRPHYEQQIDLETGELVGFEMLARWTSPELGPVGPDVFIPIAEQCGVISELSEQLIAQALRDAQNWDDSLTLSVNISAVQLRDPWFPQKLLKLLLNSDFPPNRMDVEISEACLQENLGAVRAMVASLKNLGVRISLDDFGTGFSTLTQLQSLPFDRVKIDRSFVAELRAAQSGDQIVSALVSLGQGLKIPVTAEGVEDATILEALRQMGTMKGQGYLYGKPENAAAVRKRLGELGLLTSKGLPSLPKSADESPSEERKSA